MGALVVQELGISMCPYIVYIAVCLGERPGPNLFIFLVISVARELLRSGNQSVISVPSEYDSRFRWNNTRHIFPYRFDALNHGERLSC